MGEVNKPINRSKLRHLLLVSVISLCSSLLFLYPSSFLHYFNLYNFSSLPSQILSHTIDKNCIFLLCNGLLVFVGITRSFSKPDPDHDHDPHRVYDDEEPLECRSSLEDHTSEVEVKELMVDVESEEEEEDDDEAEGKENGEFGLDLKQEEEEEEEEGSKNDEILIEESVEEENLGLSLEQMNKKFDDFIRRMKEDLRIEAKRQLVMV